MMESVDEYYKSKLRVYITTALLLTWDFFAKANNSDIDFEFLKISINVQAIPFLLSILVLFSLYTMAFHWKMIKVEKNSLSKTDYYGTVVFCFIGLLISFMHQINTSNSQLFLMDAIGYEVAFVVGFVVTLISFNQRRIIKNSTDEFFKILTPKQKKYYNRVFYGELAITVVGFIGLLVMILTANQYFKLSVYEAIYFFSFQIIVVAIFTWAVIN
jgi:hypothetical protein